MPGVSRLTQIAQFILIPLVVVTIAVSVFLLFGLVASDVVSPHQYLREIRSGSANRRWQAAWELSRHLRQEGGSTAAELVPEMIASLQAARNDDPKVRRYLARALGYVGDRRAVPVLIEALADPDPDTRLWAAEALGAIGDPAAAKALIPLLQAEDPDLRKQAVYSVGALADSDQADPIVALLSDPVADVRWNAALALARLGDARGAVVLAEMLDRERLRAVPGIRPDQEEAAMAASLAAVGELGLAELQPRIHRISREDPSLHVRQAALRALERLGADAASDARGD